MCRNENNYTDAKTDKKLPREENKPNDVVEWSFHSVIMIYA